MPSTFEALGLQPELLQTLTELNYAEPTRIQAESIPHLLDGRDVMGRSQTGTGKTAAFTLPMLQRMGPDDLQAIILVPTRELAIQIADAVYRYGNRLGIRVLPIYGQQSYDRQIRRLKKGVHVVVGTPGRTRDLIERKALDLSRVRYLVLDEADEMLKMGFIDDVETIIGATDASTRQTALFSATLSDTIQRIGKKYMNNPVVVAIDARAAVVENITQRHYVVDEHSKVAALSRLLEVEDLNNTLIFTRTKVGASQLSETLLARGYPAEAIHGDLPQAERERILRRFRSGTLSILVATDVVARGMDIPDVSHVINFDIPQLANEYVHRIGRTGRAGRAGDAITLITPRQRGHLRRIEHETRKAIKQAVLPSRDDVLRRRNDLFKQQMIDQIAATDAGLEHAILSELIVDGYTPEQVAAASIRLLRTSEAGRPLEDIADIHEQSDRRRKNKRTDRRNSGNRRTENRPYQSHEQGMVRLCMDIGRSNGIRPADVVFGIASQANIPGRSIGAINIRQNETYLDVPEAHVKTVLRAMKHGKIRGRSTTLVKANGVFDPSISV